MQSKRRQFLGALGASAAAAAALGSLVPQFAAAQGAAPVAGTDYRAVDPPQPTETGAKIEVIEFMWYGCPHCYAFEPPLTAWLQRLPSDVAFRRIPAQFGDVWVQHAKLFYALDVLGEEKRLHKKVFDTIHINNKPLDQDADMIEFAAQNGIDRAKFTDALNSFGVVGKLRRAKQVVANYQIDGVPGIAINGKYLTAPSMTRSSDRCLMTIDFLIDAERKKKKV
jgi:thiol:disulfide interchange protein DsbA